MTTNERFIKLSSRLPIAEDIALGDDVVVTINNRSYICNAVKSEYEDNQDGTQNVIYKLKHTGE